MSKYPGLNTILMIAMIWSCARIKDGDRLPLARVGDKVLYINELKAIIPSGISSDDSTLLAEDYIKKWIRSQLLIRKAEENLTFAQKDVTRELLDYRNSLIIFRYQKELMAQKMDTIVTNAELLKYYEQNKENFNLNRNIVKAIFVKIPLEVNRPEQVKAFCEQYSPAQMDELREFCLKFAVSYDIFVEKWVDFKMIIQNLPLEIDDETRYLRQNRTIELRDEQFYYLVCVFDYRLAGSVAPVEYVEENIRSLIINKRKIDFLRKTEDEIYNEGIRKNSFTIYTYDVDKEK